MAEYSWYRPTGASGATAPAKKPYTSTGVQQMGPEQDNYADLGSMSFNPADPIQSGVTMAEDTSNVLVGLKNALFGSNQQDRLGHHGGVLGDVPLVGDIGRGAGNVIGGVGSAVVDVGLGVGGAAINALEKIPSLENQKAQDAFARLPDWDPNKVEALKIIEEQKQYGFAGRDATQIMADAVDAFHENAKTTASDPSPYDNLWTLNASLADSIGNIFASMEAPGRALQTAVVGNDDPSTGKDAYEFIMAVGDGTEEFDQLWSFGENTQSGLDPVEQHMYDMVKSGQWGREQALNYLVGHGRGWSHDKLTQIGMEILLDPVNLAAMAFSGGAAAGMKAGSLSKAMRTAEAAYRAAEAGDITTATGKILSGAARASKVESLRKAYESEKAMYAVRTIRKQGDSARWNLIGRMAETQSGTQLVKIIGAPYVAAQGTEIARVGKIARTIIDPFHRIGLPSMYGRDVAAQIDMTSELVTKHGIQAAGTLNHLSLMDKLTTVSPDLNRVVGDSLGTHFGNQSRIVLMNGHRDSVVARTDAHIRGMLKEAENIGTIAEQLSPMANRGLLKTLQERANKWLIRVWDDDSVANLGTRFHRMFGDTSGMDIEESLAFVKGLNKDERSLLHQATFGRAIDMLDDILTEPGMIAASKGEDLKGIMKFVAEGRITLLNRDTLTTIGADGILKRIADARSVEDQIAEIRMAMHKYPVLGYISIDNTDLAGSVKTFTDFLTRKKKSLPGQFLDDEIAEAPQLEALQDAFDGAFTLGFRPEQEFLWNVERVGAKGGAYAAVGDVWVPLVGKAAKAYRAAEGTRVGVGGMPMALKRPVDWLEAAASTIGNGITGTMISEAARSVFVGKIHRDWQQAGLTKSIANDMWDAAQDAVRATDNTVSSARGFSANSLYNSVREVIPLEARTMGFDERALMSSLLDAYAGDFRQIGATQWLSSRAKKVLFDTTGSNIAGQVAENVWPLMKFRINAVFQMQERIEPVVLNIQRGVIAAMGSSINSSDILTDRVLAKLTEKSLIRMGDFDIHEMSAGVLAASRAERMADLSGTRLAALKNLGQQLMDVKGAKQINLLRTFRHGLGKEIKEIMDAVQPGEWEKMHAHAQSKLNYLLSDDDFAIQLLADNLISSDVVVKRALEVGKKFSGFKAVFDNAIKQGQWALPSHIGALNPLMFDHLTSILGAPGVTDEHSLRAALAAKKVDMESVKRILRLHGADQDYINRMENALNFHWDDFSATIQREFNMTDKELRMMQDLISYTAEMRGMNPVEYLSQVFSPNLIKGHDALIGELGRELEVLRAGKMQKVPQLAQFASEEGSKMEDFIRQYTTVFAAHLDPSMKRALLMEMVGETGQGPLTAATRTGQIRLDANDVREMWTSDAESWLADRIIKYVTGAPGSGPHTIVTGRGSALAQNSRAEYLASQGRSELGATQREYEVGDDTLSEITGEYQASDGIPFTVDPDAKVTATGFGESLTKPPMIRATTNARTNDAYQAFVTETRAQYTHMTTGKNKVRVQISKVVPYRKKPTKVEGKTADEFAAHFDALRDKVHAAEKVSDPKDWTPEMRAAYDRGDYAEFSRLRGYTPEEIADYEELIRLQKLIPQERLEWITDPRSGTPIVNGKDLYKEIIKVTPAQYDNAAMQADIAAGKIRVYGGDVSHPIMTPEQVVEFRAVHSVYGMGAGGHADDLKGQFNAALDHSQMYETEARQAMLSDLLGPMANDMLDTRVIPEFKGPPKTAQEFYEKWWPADKGKTEIKRTKGFREYGPDGKPLNNPDGTPKMATVYHQQPERLGPGVHALEADEQAELLEIADRIMEQFPSVKLGAIDVMDIQASGLADSPGVMAVTFVDDNNTIVIGINKRYFGKDKAKYRKRLKDSNAGTPFSESFSDSPDVFLQPVKDGKPNWDAFDAAEDDWASVGEWIYDKMPIPVEDDRITKLGAILAKYEAEQGFEAGERDMKELFGNLFEDAYEPARRVKLSVPVADNGKMPEIILEFRKLYGSEGIWSDLAQIKRKVRRSERYFAKYNVGTDLETTFMHEFGHALFDSLALLKHEGDPVSDALKRFNDLLFGRKAQLRQLSEYGMTKKSDAFAELFALLSSSNDEVVAHGLEVFNDNLPLKASLLELREILVNHGILKNPVREALPGAGMMVKDYAASIPGRYSRPKGTLLGQRTTDMLHERFIGVGKHSEANPDVSRASRMFAKWSNDGLRHVMEYGDSSEYADVFRGLGLVPSEQAVPYNFNDAVMNQMFVESMQNKWKDAFRLQYFAQERSMFQRSINHPMFGIYPASYMWGKIAPEMIQFIAQRPFGVRTGAMLYAMKDAQRAIALQREMDPEFDKQIEDLGHNAALSWLGYMLPTLPWDVNAGLPVWARDLAKQGLVNDNRMERGQPVNRMNLVSPVSKAVEKLNPMTTSIPWATRAIESITGPNKYDEQKPGYQAPAQAAPSPAGDLQPVMEDSLSDLTRLFGG